MAMSRFTKAFLVLISLYGTANANAQSYGQSVTLTSTQSVSSNTLLPYESSRRSARTLTTSYRDDSTRKTSGSSFSRITRRSSVTSDISASSAARKSTSPSSTQTASRLQRSITNGDSLLGTLDALTYPKYLGADSGSNFVPWSDRNAWDVNPYSNSPNTGVTRRFEYTVSNSVLYPDGYRKEMLLVNNQFPGPVLEANWGDIVMVTVHNNFSGEAPQQTAIHWHGILQHKTIWYDGAPGIVQCPIVPGDSLTYAWKAELYGSSWYHGHLSAHWVNGLLGPMIIHGPNHIKHDIDIGPVMLSDWYHRSGEVISREILEPKPQFEQPPSDNNLINGKNPLPCPSGTDRTICLDGAYYAEFLFQPGKTHLLRLVNSGAQAVQKFSIDGHKLLIIANDFVPVEPYEVNVVTLGIGQRTDILVQGDQNPGQSYWMRSTATCSKANNPNAKAIIYYANNDSNSYTNKQDDRDMQLPGEPTTEPQPDDSISRNPACGNDPLEMTKPIYKMPAKKPSVVKQVEMSFGQNSTGSWVWSMNNNSYLTDFSNPALQLLSENKADVLLNDPKRKPYFLPEDVTTYRFIIQNSSPSPHPMHYHGHYIQVLYVSTSPWSQTESSLLESRTINPSNPQRRDVQQVPPGGYLVIQSEADNPGAWGLHCHMAFHIGAGLFMEVIEGKDKLLGKRVPDDIVDGCRRWREWNQRNLDDAKVWDSGQRL